MTATKAELKGCDLKKQSQTKPISRTMNGLIEQKKRISGTFRGPGSHKD